MTPEEEAEIISTELLMPVHHPQGFTTVTDMVRREIVALQDYNCENYAAARKAVEKLTKTREKLRAAKELLKDTLRSHVNTFDGHGGTYCQSFVMNNKTGEHGPCTCGAEEWNKRVRALLD